MSLQDEILSSLTELKQSLTLLSDKVEANNKRLDRIETEVSKIAGGLAVVLAHDKVHQSTLDDHKKKFIPFKVT